MKSIRSRILRLAGGLLLSLGPLAVRAGGECTPADRAIDTVIRVDRVQVTAIKQGLILGDRPTAATVIGSESAERRRIDALKKVSTLAPNFFIPDYGSRMTSSIYVRGLGTRIEQPVVGMNVDNVPVLNKDCYDTDLVDIERIEVLRGPQSTLYGRNAMGGAVNLYTLSPLSYQGVRLGAEYGSGGHCKFRAASYYKLEPGLGMAVTAFYTRTGGFYENAHTGEKCDRERMGGGRMKLQWRGRRGLQIDNTLAFSVLDQGGYPYAYAGETLRDEAGRPIIRPGEIRYDDPCSYGRTAVSDGLTLRYDAARFSVSSITSYQFSDDEMILDQDFLPLSYFTLRQARTSHAVTEDLVFRGRDEGRYGWLLGAFGFYRHDRMQAPVVFKKEGIERLILRHVNSVNPNYVTEWDDDRFTLGSRFRTSAAGGALYHESNLTAGRWRFTAGIRLDFEFARMRYRNTASTGCMRYRIEEGERIPDRHKEIEIDNDGRLQLDFAEWLPEAAVAYRIDAGNLVYLSAAKGYKAGGFNTQMFSDVLQQQIMKEYFSVGAQYDIRKVVTYKPEKSWNFEAGCRFSLAGGALRGDAALFWIECRDQQLTVFPDGTTTGRMMTNAGRTRSRGVECTVQASPWRQLDLTLAYGFTDARFRRYRPGLRDAQGRPVDYAGNRIPYAPRHTLAAAADYTFAVGRKWLERIVLHAGMQGAGAIAWNERNSLRQPFYALLEAAVRFEHRRYAIDLRSENLGGRRYDTFYFESIGNAFVQRGRPRTFSIALNLYL